MTKTETPEPLDATEPDRIPSSTTASPSIRCLLALALLYTIYFANSLLIPIVVALLFALLLSPNQWSNPSHPNPGASRFLACSVTTAPKNPGPMLIVRKNLTQKIKTGSAKNSRRSIVLVRTIEVELSRYILTVSAINTCLGLATAAALWLLGVQDALLWGAMGVLLAIPLLVCLKLAIGQSRFLDHWVKFIESREFV